MTTRLFPPNGSGPTGALALDRRGVRHGFVDPRATDATEDAEAEWRRGAPIHWPGILAAGIELFCSEIRATCAMFDRLRDGARWLDECDHRVGDDPDFRYSSSTVDKRERREIERLFVDAVDADGIRIARDLTARLSWVADDETDLSLRIRFSFGHESLREWLAPDDARATLAGEFATRVFPECALLTHPQLVDALAKLPRAPVRLAERIVYSNAPGGGAVFHHDADPDQRGVVFGQLAGHTAWLALPRRELAELVAACDPRFGDIEAASAALDDIDEPLWRLLNMEPTFTRRVADKGGLIVLEPGDVLVLPSPDQQHTAWHSVFALGEVPSLGLSFGIFDAR